MREWLITWWSERACHARNTDAEDGSYRYQKVITIGRETMVSVDGRLHLSQIYTYNLPILHIFIGNIVKCPLNFNIHAYTVLHQLIVFM